MKVLVTGSAGHLGEALAITLTARGDEVVGLDRLASPHTTHVGSITDRDLVRECLTGVETVFHAATLHKPHVDSHSRQAFIDTNITGTLTLLDAASEAGVGGFIFTSTTSVYGHALTPPSGEAAVWVTEDLRPRSRNIYGATKLAAEDLCRLARRDQGMACIILRTSRFFPEEDDDADIRVAFPGENPKMNEFLYRRADIEDVVGAHLLAAERACAIGFGLYIVSATTPFSRQDLAELARDATAVVRRVAPQYVAAYARLGWRMLDTITRVYDNSLARRSLGWTPKHDFASMLERLDAVGSPMSDLARRIGAKGYHA